jgi:hypothetical protein
MKSAFKRKKPLFQVALVTLRWFGDLSVIPLGFEPRTPTLKVLCSTS